MVDSGMTASINPQPSTFNPQLLLRARVVLPVSRPPIPDGAVLVTGRRIAAVGRWRDLAAHSPKKTLDLGEAVLLPGLVNAHCHLDYTDMAGQFPPPKVFTDWLKLITATKVIPTNVFLTMATSPNVSGQLCRVHELYPACYPLHYTGSTTFQ